MNIDVNPNRKYTIEILAGNHYYTGDIYVEKINNEYASEISANYPDTHKKTAESLMTTVKVPVWKMKSEKKVPSTITLTVHNKIAHFPGTAFSFKSTYAYSSFIFPKYASIFSHFESAGISHPDEIMKFSY